MLETVQTSASASDSPAAAIEPRPESGPRVLVAGAGRGFALGALVVALGCAAFAGQAFRTGVQVVDLLLGATLVCLLLLLVQLLVLLPTTLLARVLGAMARRAPVRAARLIRRPIPLLRFAGRMLVGTTIGIGLLLWVVPSSGPLAMFHSLFFFEIPIVGGAFAGLLLGVAMAARRLALPVPNRNLVTALALVPGLALAIGLAAWSVFPGVGDPIVRESPAAVGRIAMLGLPDPSQPGPYTVVAAAYGSGTDGRRPEFGSNVSWRTPTIDASGALPSRDGLADAYARWFWGFDTTHLPVNGLVWYPADAPGRLPLVLIAHGNHDAGEFSDPGYAYLGEHLASHGMIAVAVDENFLNGDAFFDYGGAEEAVRAWLLLRHLEQFRTWDAQPGHPLASRVDLDRVALVGHSRGGEAAAAAAMIEANAIAIPGLPTTPTGFGIRAVVGIAPSDTMYSGPGAPVRLDDVDYLVLQGAHDGDLPAFTGLDTYHRVDLGDRGDHLKVAVYSERANHGRFNTVWDIGDAGLLESWMLDRGSMLATQDQQRLAKTVIGAFLARSLQGQTAYDAFFRDPRAGRGWLPDDVVETHWQSSARIGVEDFGTSIVDGGSLHAAGFTGQGIRDPGLRDGTRQGDDAAWLRWTGPATYTIDIGQDGARGVGADDSLVFAMAGAGDPAQAIDASVVIGWSDGTSSRVALSEVAPVRPLLPTTIWKIAALGDRYLPTEKRTSSTERFLQTYEVPLARSGPSGRSTEAHVSTVAFAFEGSGSVYLDDVGFEPPVASSSR